MKRINKKAQEEMVGFVFIVIIVIIALVILLFIYINNEKDPKDNKEISQLLGSVMDYTSECAMGFEPAYSNLGELLEQCRGKRKCTNGKSACEVLNKTMVEILDASVMVKNNSYTQGYIFVAVRRQNISSSIGEEKIIEIRKGTCNKTEIGSESASPGRIISSLSLCF